MQIVWDVRYLANVLVKWHEWDLEISRLKFSLYATFLIHTLTLITSRSPSENEKKKMRKSVANIILMTWDTGQTFTIYYYSRDKQIVMWFVLIENINLFGNGGS